MEENILHRKERIIITTIDIIDEIGILSLSTREIARRQGVSEATLFRHFKSKNDILIAVLDYFSQFDTDIYQSTILKKLKPIDAVTYYVTANTEYYENYPAITSIMQIFDVLKGEQGLTDKINEIKNRSTHYLKLLIEEAQLVGDLRVEIDSEILALMISGLCREICLTWRLSGKNFSLKEKTLIALKLLLEKSR
ncbi:MAG: transcriptional regulator TetR family [Anaerocolumna sp.]|jgi:AcrR family transcriptional regulator|nr:transcriptional regulator TetR family [Anaerocolumna sp.]